MTFPKKWLAFAIAFLVPLSHACAVDDSEEIYAQTSTAAQKSNVFKITSYGISPNSTSDAVPAILAAAQAAQSYVNANNKPAIIAVPAGKFYISQFELQNLENITLRLGKNAGLYAYPKSTSINTSNAYITINNCKTFVIRGAAGSLIDGNGSSWWSGDGSKPYLMTLSNCSDYQLYGFTLQNSPFHTLTLTKCTNGVIHDLSILAPSNSGSTDGIDPMGDIDTLEIYNCTINNGDDGIAINSVSGPSQNIHIHDCQFINGHGMSIGSAVENDITNVLVENLTINNAWYAIRLKFAYFNQTANLKNITYNNITAQNLTKSAIEITNAYNGDKPNTKVTLDDISINNFTCTNVPQGLNFTMSSSKQVLTPIILNNVLITGTTKKDSINNCPITRQ